MQETYTLQIQKLQVTDSVFLIRPYFFCYNEDASKTNSFMHNNQKNSEAEIHRRALYEFDCFAKLLVENKINVNVFQDTQYPHTPDSIFPNNWITMHSNGEIITYPMQPVNRRKERRYDILDKLGKSGFKVTKTTNLESFEKENKFLEGTGSMVFDRENRIIYSCISQRTDLELLLYFGKLRNYKVFYFEAVDKSYKPVYHTNVVMSLGEDFAVICDEAITSKTVKEYMFSFLEKSGRRIIRITLNQMYNFAGNILQLKNRDKDKVVVMSESAFDSFTDEQLAILGRESKIVYSNLSTIEKYGGGSARCMIAEIFLPH